MIPLQVGILSGREGWHSQALARAWRELGIEPVFIDPVSLQSQLGKDWRVLSKTLEVNRLDLLLTRWIPGGSLEQVIFRMDALHQLEDQGVRLVNRPGAIEKMVDKYYTLSLLQQAGLRVPETLVMENLDQASQAFIQLGEDVVIKPLFGARGAGMVRVSDRDIFFRVVHALSLNQYVLYLQKFIPHGHSDLRVMVVNGECITAMERISTGWKTNIHQGATPSTHVLDEDEESASICAAKAVGADYCGVDLLRDEFGILYVIEANSMPAWEGLQQVTGFDIAARIVAGCMDLLKREA